MIKRGVVIGVCLFSSLLYGTDLKPWYPRCLEFQSSFTYLHEQYCEVDEGTRVIHHPSKDDFYRAGLELAYDPFAYELEVTFSSTREHHLAPDTIQGTVRYQLLDDIVGDPVSLVTGVTVTQVFTQSLKDISTFHHGGIEAEFHVAVGRECPCYNTWVSRYFGVGGFGIADHGSPWLHGILAWEKNWFDKHHVHLYLNALYGLGDQDLNVFDFDGYGSIRHQSIDLGAQYRYIFCTYSSLTAGYAHRVHAKNGPKNTNIYYIKFNYPFGL